ncbi:MAG: hypothetical protein JWP89_1147 [Schlesneria sp.]|nr:hypothetical protein [Schlesneria sp.]
MSRRMWLMVLLTVCLALPACQSGRSEPRKYAVSGTVTLDDKPLADGLIYFKTIATGAIECLDIKAGKFKGQAEPGDRRVEISSLITKTETFDGMKSETKQNLIPTQYNMDSTLTAKVATTGSNEFKFELKSK